MILKTATKQINYVKESVIKLPPAGSLAFGLACMERQWPIFERASSENHSTPREKSIFRQALNTAWECLTAEKTFSDGPISECGREMQQMDDPLDAPSVAAFTIANFMIDLLNAIKDHDRSYSYHLSGHNIGLLELLEDSLGESKVDAVEIARILTELEAAEIQRQNDDLQALHDDPSPQGIERLRRAAGTVGLYGKYWFRN